MENFVISELLKHRVNAGIASSCYFYRDSNQREIDFLIKEGNLLIPVEIKSSSTFHNDFLKGLTYFKQLVSTRCQQGYLIYAGEREQRIHDVSVINFRHTKKMALP